MAIGTDVQARRVARAQRVARLLDARFRLPIVGVRFGWDAILGVVPGVGDTAAALIGLVPVVEAVRLGARRRVIVRMLANLGIDWLIGLIPGLDLVADVAFKANLRNAELLASEAERTMHRRPERGTSRKTQRVGKTQRGDGDAWNSWDTSFSG